MLSVHFIFPEDPTAAVLCLTQKTQLSHESTVVLAQRGVLLHCVEFCCSKHTAGQTDVIVYGLCLPVFLESSSLYKDYASVATFPSPCTPESSAIAARCIAERPPRGGCIGVYSA